MRILVLHDTPTDFEQWLCQRLSQDEIHFATRPEAVSARLGELNPEVIFSIKHSQFPGEYHRLGLECESVRWFQVGGSGTDHLGAWNPDRVTVTNCAGVLADFHAERAMSGLLTLSTGLLGNLRAQADKQWKPTRFETLQDKTLLVVGLGATGTAFAKLARALGMRVLGVKRQVVESDVAHEVFDFSELPNLWARADVVSMNVPLNETTRSLLDERALQKLRRGAFVLNGARGGVLCQDALIRALDGGELGGAWLDVTSPEPLPKDSPLWSHPKVIVTPHSADQVQDFPLRFAKFFAQNVDRYRKAAGLENVVLPN